MAEELFKKTFTIYSRNFDKAGENSTDIKEILKSLRFDADIIRRVVVVAFEAEMNVVMYANRGEMDFVITDEDIRIKIADEGPGIPDIEQAMQEGYSTATDEMREMGFGFGMGLPNIKKNSDFLNIESRVGKGTTVSAGIKLNSNA
jgi:anti-sigma regulatory factor (Ser/Thr protein kinase)